MRHWLLVFLIALTPLRGWAGDVMAVAVAVATPAQHRAEVQGHIASNISAAAAEPTDRVPAGTPHADCMGHSDHDAVTPGDADSPQDGDSGAHCAPCSACPLCSAAALALHTRIAPLIPAFQGVPAAIGIAFTSAEPARGFKPPIS